MEVFYEKADKEILEKCYKFITDNLDIRSDYTTYREALYLSCKLIDSILESQKEYNDEIAKLIKLGINFKEYRTANGFEFHYSNDILYLYFDKDAHEILEKLELIQDINKD